MLLKIGEFWMTGYVYLSLAILVFLSIWVIKVFFVQGPILFIKTLITILIDTLKEFIKKIKGFFKKD